MNNSGKTSTRLLAVVAVLAAASLLFVWWKKRPSVPEGVTPPPIAGGTEAHRAVSPPAETEHEATARIHATIAELRARGKADAARQSLGELRQYLAGLPRDAAVAAIQDALRSGADAPSGLDFKIKGGGGLSDAPSMRVFLLDYLAQLDPAAAAEYAKTVLSSMNSPDEWAVALRTVALAQTDDAGRAFLEEKVRTLLTHEPWVQESSTGFLEAFDVAVYLRATNLVPEITALIRKTDNRAAAHAAFLTLDRLTIADPAPMLSKLADDPSLMEGREVTRANYFARADVSDAGQRAVVERYLLDARRGKEELQTFAGLFPNANYMVSQNLLTPTVTPNRGQLVARDQASLQVVNEWLADPRFAALRPQLEKTRSRLQTFVTQANQ